MKHLYVFLLYFFAVSILYGNGANPCPNPPPTPEATITYGVICYAFYPASQSVLTVTYPLGNEYRYSINGITYQSSPVFFGVWYNNFPIMVTVKDESGCVSEPLELDLSDIELSSVPMANVTQPDCSDVPESGQFGAITVTFPLGSIAFQYSIDGENYQNSPVFSNIPPGSYGVTYRFSMANPEICTSDPLEVVINSTNVPTPIADVIQPDCDNPYGIIVVTTPFANAYEYSINGIDYQPGNVFENVSAGTYQVTVRKGDCISEILEVNIHFAPTVPDTPTVTVVQPDCHNPYGSIEVKSPVDEGHELFPNYEYSINGVDYYDHTIFDNLPSGLYYVTVRHVFSGCVSDFSEVILKEDLVCFIPKGISPNGDFLNDEFDLSDFGIVPSVQIFNRYGKEVYFQKDYTNQWKGQSSKGKELRTGTYYYVITFQNEEIKTGWVYLNREY